MASPINFLLLIELIVVVIVASAFLFYWNRLLGSVVAFFIRLYTWRYFSAYISIGSLQVSPLAGRISFRDVEYHSSNISFRALHGHITWRYWILRVRQEADSQSTNTKRSTSFRRLAGSCAIGDCRMIANVRSPTVPDHCLRRRSGMFRVQQDARLRRYRGTHEKA